MFLGIATYLHHPEDKKVFCIVNPSLSWCPNLKCGTCMVRLYLMKECSSRAHGCALTANNYWAIAYRGGRE